MTVTQAASNITGSLITNKMTVWQVQINYKLCQQHNHVDNHNGKFPSSPTNCQKRLQVLIFVYRHFPDQQQFTMQSGVLTSTSSRQYSAISGRPLPVPCVYNYNTEEYVGLPNTGQQAENRAYVVRRGWTVDNNEYEFIMV